MITEPLIVWTVNIQITDSWGNYGWDSEIDSIHKTKEGAINAALVLSYLEYADEILAGVEALGDIPEDLANKLYNEEDEEIYTLTDLEKLLLKDILKLKDSDLNPLDIVSAIINMGSYTRRGYYEGYSASPVRVSAYNVQP